MKTITTVLAASVLALTGATAVSAETIAEKGEARLAQMLEGRTAGEPVSCISVVRSNNVEVIEHVGVVYDNGRTIYVSRPTDPKSLGPWDVPVIERTGGQICKTDLTRTIDRSDGHISGVVFLNDFLPYTKEG